MREENWVGKGKRKKEKKKNDECFFDFMCVGNGNWNLCSPKRKSKSFLRGIVG